MKGYIDKSGRLFIIRPGVKKEDIMPVECRNAYLCMPCGHKCSRFEEPYYWRGKWCLNLCTKVLEFDEFEDQRGKEDNDL